MAIFPNEIFSSPKPWVTSRYPDIVSYNKLPEGGHFAAFEVPKVLYKDFVDFVQKVEARRSSSSAGGKKAEEL